MQANWDEMSHVGDMSHVIFIQIIVVDKCQVNDKWLQTKKNKRLNFIYKNLKNPEGFVYNCSRDWLLWKFQKFLRKTSQLLRPLA